MCVFGKKQLQLESYLCFEEGIGAHDSYSQNTHTGVNLIQIRNSYLPKNDAITEFLLKESEFYVSFNCMTDLMFD